MATVVLNHVSKSFGETVVLDDLNLNIADEEFLVLVGPSGCGKSTVLRLISGLEAVTSGDIMIDGLMVNHVSPKDRDIAMVFQNYALYPHMTVYDNMAFGLKMRKFKKAAIQERVLAAAKILDLESLLKRKPKQLSGGQRQRVALGRAIVREPKVFLMDEPLSNLDAKLRVQMRAEIAALHRRLKTTFIYVTHDQTEAMTMGQRIVVLNKGKIQQVDTPITIYNQPANMFVADFMGQMNFWHGAIANGRFEATEGLSFDLPKAMMSGWQSMMGQPVVLGIRPEHFELSESDTTHDASTETSVVVMVKRVELMGSEQWVYFDVNDKTYLVKLDSQCSLAVEQSLCLTLDLVRVNVFDAQTEARLNLEERVVQSR